MKEKMACAEAHLRHFAELYRFWIFKAKDIQPGLIHYLDSQGKAFVLMDDNNERVEECIELLGSRNCTVFDDADAMDKYAEQLAKTVK